MSCTFRGERLFTWYYAFVLMGCYAVGELGHFIIGIISKPISQELHFGEKGCVTNSSEIESQVEKLQKCSGMNFTMCHASEHRNKTYCRWDYTGSGIEYQILAGPSFIAIFTVMGIVIGVLGDKYNRVRLLTVCMLLYSTMALLSGFSNSYWQLIIFRLGFGAGEAGCTPLTASIVADKFSKESRGLAMSIFNWGIYFGYGLAFAVGNYVTEANILGQGWRWSYYVTAIPGFLMMVVLFFTIREPKRKMIGMEKAKRIQEDEKKSDNETDAAIALVEEACEMDKSPGLFTRLWSALRLFITKPPVLMLLLAASVRHTASFCWAYNTQLYFNHYFPGTDVGLWMTVCSIVGGTIGIATGGIISDLVVSRYGMRTRLWVLVISQGIAAPLAAMVLYLEPPYCFVSLMAAYLFAEMWFGVLFTVLVEIFPRKMCSTAIAIFIFVINNVASNGQLTVPVLKPILGFRNTLCITYVGFYAATEMWYGVAVTVIVELVPVTIRSTAVAMYGFVLGNVGGNLPVVVTLLKQVNPGGLRFALYIMYPGGYLLSSFLFLLTQLLLLRESKKENVGLKESSSKIADSPSPAVSV